MDLKKEVISKKTFVLPGLNGRDISVGRSFYSVIKTFIFRRVDVVFGFPKEPGCIATLCGIKGQIQEGN